MSDTSRQITALTTKLSGSADERAAAAEAATRGIHPNIKVRPPPQRVSQNPARVRPGFGSCKAQVPLRWVVLTRPQANSSLDVNFEPLHRAGGHDPPARARLQVSDVEPRKEEAMD